MALAACAPSGDTTTVPSSQLYFDEPLTSDALFNPERVLHVDVQMNPADYEILRNEGRSVADVATGCMQGFEYTRFTSTVTIDGVEIEDVEIRKKGYMGSLSANRPSLKLNFAANVDGRRFEGADRLTLNNNRSDPSATRQCLTYDLFDRVGLVAPRCNFARVSVNGEDLGYYSNIESIDELFLQRNFDDAGGNLYEAQVGAFTEELKHNFELKTNKEIADRSDLDAVISALDTDDSNLMSVLNQVLDVDQFIDFWAMEIITGHADGATANLNNYFVYRKASDDRFVYIPWGTDIAFSNGGKFLTGNYPIWHKSAVADRLYSVPAARDKLYQRIDELLSQIYNVDSLHAEIDRIQQLADSSMSSVEKAKAFTAAQAEHIQQAMAGELDDNNTVITDVTTGCSAQSSYTISGELTEQHGRFNYVTRAGESVSVSGPVRRSKPNSNINPPITSFEIDALRDGHPVKAVIRVESPDLKQGRALFHGIATTFSFHDSSPDSAVGSVSAGYIEFEEVSDAQGDISGEFEAQLVYVNE